MSRATLVRPAPSVVTPSLATRRAQLRLVDAVSAYDAALDSGAPMVVLVRLDQEVAAATRHHHAVLAAR